MGVLLLSATVLPQRYQGSSSAVKGSCRLQGLLGFFGLSVCWTRQVQWELLDGCLLVLNGLKVVYLTRTKDIWGMVQRTTKLE